MTITPSSVLALMQFPPSPNGHGGSQRAWHLLNALAAAGPVDLVLLEQPGYRQPGVDLAPVHALTRSVTVIPIAEWDPTARRHRIVPRRIGRWIDLARIGSIYTPRFRRRTLATIARALPVRHASTLFAGRLSAAVIAEQLVVHGLLAADRKVVDFDDIQSRFQQRELQAARQRFAPDVRALDTILLKSIQRAEARVATEWDAVGVCSDEDVDLLAQAHPGAHVVKVPNVVDRPLLPPPSGDPFSLLFVGNLGFGPNMHGLTLFLDEAWPLIVAACPQARLDVVGMSPDDTLIAKLRRLGIGLHADVPSVLPFYAAADAVIAPILFGSGTRIKILEAMALGRPVIATSLGAEGLGVVPGQHALIADTMSGFAQAVIDLARHPERGPAIAREARALQQQRFGQPAMDAGVAAMLATRRDPTA